MYWRRDFVVVCLLVFCTSGGAQAQRNTAEGINTKPYRVLCDVYNVAANPPKTLYDNKEVDEIRGKIDVINVSLADDDWFNEISETTEGGKLTDAFKSQNGGFESLFERWKAGVSKVKERALDINKLPAANQAVKVAQTKLKTIESQVEKIVKSLKEFNTSAKLDDIKKSFDAAIGEDGCSNAATCGIVGNRGTTTCGTAVGERGTGGVATPGGANLIVDFFCLCAKDASGAAGGNANGKECIDTTLTAVGAQWGAGSVQHARELWEALKGGCQAGYDNQVTTRAIGNQALSTFLAEVGRVATAAEGTGGSKRIGPGILGVCALNSGVCAGACDGDMQSGDSKGICVAYGQKPSEWENIDWFKNMRRGLELLAAAENKTISINYNLAHLKLLQSRAEEIYAETKVTLGLEKINSEKTAQAQNQTQGGTISADKSTYQESSTMNAATIQRFILPCTLLI